MTWLHRFAVFTAFSTLVLLFAGGLVTTTASGDSVPDWWFIPLSYGTLTPPMVGGIQIEHPHRLIASFVGLLTLVLAAWIWKTDSRKWVRKLGLLAVVGVCVQGILGGLRVKLVWNPAYIAIIHACFAQAFFGLVVAIGLVTSKKWAEETTDLKPSLVPTYAGIATVLIYLQTILGAVRRHTGWGLNLHAGFAGLVAIFVILAAVEAFRSGRFRKTAAALLVILAAQIALGIWSYLIVTRGFVRSISASIGEIVAVTGHLAVGAMLYVTALVLALRSFRVFGVRSEEPVPATSRLRDYVTLTKPGISMMVLVTALAGYVIASRGHVEAMPILNMLIGTALTAAAANSLNMLWERKTDALMRRTALRPTVTGRLSATEVVVFASICLVGGVTWLAFRTNLLTAGLALTTVATYLLIYTPLKPRTSLSTVAGAFPGALPPLIGWAAATGTLNFDAFVVFAIQFFWQLPHFLAIAWNLREEYSKAGFPLLSVTDPEGGSTARQIVFQSQALLVVSLIPAIVGQFNAIYFALALALGIGFLVLGIQFAMAPSRLGARRVFFASIVYLPCLFALLAGKAVL